MKRVYLYIILVVVVVGTGGYFLLTNGSSKDVKYRTEKASRGSIVKQVRATGTINPTQTVKVGSQVSGTIAKIYVDFNSQVKKGQIIAQIDSTFLDASVKEAQANLERNQAQVNETKRALVRTQELFKKELVSQADLDAAQTAYEAALAQLKQTRAALDRALVNLRYSIIRAPIDGVIISRDVDVGQTVAASLQAPQLFAIANDLTHMQVEASVDEADIGQIRESQRVTFTVDSYPEDQFVGTVTQVRLAPTTVQNVVTYTVIIDVPNPDLKLRPGMTATVSVLIDQRNDVLRVPTLALRFQPPPDVLQSATKEEENKTEVKDTASQSRTGERNPERRMRFRSENGEQGRNWNERFAMQRPSVAHIWVLDGNKNLKQVTVRTGLNDNRYVEVLGGELKEGDDVILGITGGETASGPQMQQQTNPFQQRMPGGGGGGRRGF